jgi:hypothetical protein
LSRQILCGKLRLMRIVINGMRLILLVCAACTALFLMPALAAAQGAGEEGTSLGDIARQQRRKQAVETKKPGKVFTNDDFPAHPPNSPPTKLGAETPPAGTGKASEQPASDSTASGSEPHDETYFRGTMKQFRKNLESDKGRLAELRLAMQEHEKDIPFNAVIVGKSGPSDQKPPVLESGQSIVEKSYSNDPRWAADPEGARRAWEAEEQELSDSIKSQKEKIAADEKAVSDFVDQCRHENCLPGWIR